MATLSILYDADCGFCRWSLAQLLRLDRRNRLRPVSLQEPEAETLLAGTGRDERMASWHLVGNLAPDHSTIAEFRCRHERALGEVFSGVLGLCARAGLVSVGVVAIDGRKMAANASTDANRDFGQIAREILAEAAAVDALENELYGDQRGDELPEQLRTREGRRQALREAKERLARERDQLRSRRPKTNGP